MKLTKLAKLKAVVLPEEKKTTGQWKGDFQYLLDRKILSRDELAYLFGQIKFITELENNQYKQLYDSLEIDVSKAVEVDEDKLLDLYNSCEVLCEVCEGCGFIGYAPSGKKISCETCGGHEDALGKGFVFDNLVQALAADKSWIKEVK